MSLSKQFAFGPLGTAAPLRSYLARQTSQNQTYSVTQTASTVAQITLPAVANSWIDNRSLVLSFDVTNASTVSSANTTTTAVSINGSAHSFIGSLKVYSGMSAASILEDVTQYAECVQLLNDLHRSPDEWKQVMSLNEGTSESTLRQGADLSAGSTTRFQIPLLSFLGLLSNNAVPLSDGYTVYITFAQASNVLYSTTTTNVLAYTVSNVRLEYNTLELDSGLNAALYRDGAISIPVTRWTTLTSTYQYGSTAYQSILGLGLRSLKSLLARFRWSTQVAGSTGQDPIANCVNPYIDSWYLMLSGTRIPSFTIDSDQTTFTRLLESRHMLQAPNTGTLIGKTSYAIKAQPTAGTRQLASYALGVDFDVLTGTDDKLASGINVSGQQLTFNLNVNTASLLATGTVNLQAVFFAEANALLTHTPGAGMIVSY